MMRMRSPTTRTPPLRDVTAQSVYDVLWKTYGMHMSLTEAAGLLNMSRKTAYNRVRTGRFPVEVLQRDGKGGRYMVPTAKLAVYLDELQRSRGQA